MLDIKCFDAIGFKAADFHEFNRYLDTARLKGQHPSSERGTYAYWHVGSGIEIWAAFDKQNRPLNSNPHFLGSSRIEARVTGMIDLASTLEGALRVHLNPRDEGAPHYPFVFNVPSWDFTRPLLKEQKAKSEGPLIISFQLTAFAEELECYDSEETYLAAQAQRQQQQHEQFGTESESETIDPAIHFIPTGLMTEEKDKPKPRASFSGEIVRGQVLTNPVTNQKTLYLGVKTLGMIVDVVADASIVKGRPKNHGIASGHFWLSGRTVEEIEATNKRLRL